MAIITVAFLGDIFGAPGRMAVNQQLPNLRAAHAPDLIIANAENAKAGSGLTPELYRKIRGYGIDAITLGDHVYRDREIIGVLELPGEPIARPANLSSKAPGRTFIRLDPAGQRTRPVYILTVLGRIFMNMPADDPFAAVERVLSQLPDANPLVILEVHMEATSEKMAMGRYFDGRVALVVGTHTHVPTADARILPRGTGFITDLGMCGPYNSVIGRDADAVVKHMTSAIPVPYGVGHGGEAVCGVVARIDEQTNRTVQIQRFQFEADRTKPPFV